VTASLANSSAGVTASSVVITTNVSYGINASYPNASWVASTPASYAVTTSSNATDNATTLRPPLTWCRYGVLDATNESLCYYNERYNSTGVHCHGDRSGNDEYCYHTVPCELGRNYRNKMCYRFVTAVGIGRSTDCRHGYYADGLCYYDRSWPGQNDVTCHGYMGDRGIGFANDGYCYNSTKEACVWANNYQSGTCYDYVILGPQKLCSHGHYFAIDGSTTNGMCYYEKATQIPSGGACNEAEDTHGSYCYSKS
jgi:hypothetical protein